MASRAPGAGFLSELTTNRLIRVRMRQKSGNRTKKDRKREEGKENTDNENKLNRKGLQGEGKQGLDLKGAKHERNKSSGKYKQ